MAKKFKIDLAALSEELKRADLNRATVEEPPDRLDHLTDELVAAREGLAPLYRRVCCDPFLDLLFYQLGEAGYDEIQRIDPKRSGFAGLLHDLSQAILLRGCTRESSILDATEAFQEVVSDLFDGFLSESDRRGVKYPDRVVFPPLVKWSNPDRGPYVYPAGVTTRVGVASGVVNLPIKYAHGGLAAWAVLSHEVGGHDILSADVGIRAELARKTHDAVSQIAPKMFGGSKKSQKQLREHLATYWSQRIDETASDILGILNMGPAAVAGLIVYLRSIRKGNTLSADGPSDDPHPADILRTYLVIEVLDLCEFSQRRAWKTKLLEEISRDIKRAKKTGRGANLAGAHFSLKLCRESAKQIAKAIYRKPLRALGGLWLGFIQNWREEDQIIVDDLSKFYFRDTDKRKWNSLAEGQASEVYAGHVVAAAVQTSLLRKGITTDACAEIFQDMVALLRHLHVYNPAWAELPVAYRGDAELAHGLEDVESGSEQSRTWGSSGKGPQRVRFSHLPIRPKRRSKKRKCRSKRDRCLASLPVAQNRISPSSYDASLAFGWPLESSKDFDYRLEAARAFGWPLESAQRFGHRVEAARAFGWPLEFTTEFGHRLEAARAFGWPLEAASDFSHRLEAARAFGWPLEGASRFGHRLEAARAFGWPLGAANGFGWRLEAAR